MAAGLLPERSLIAPVKTVDKLFVPTVRLVAEPLAASTTARSTPAPLLESEPMDGLADENCNTALVAGFIVTAALLTPYDEL